MSTTADVDVVAPKREQPETAVHHDSQEEYESAEEIEGEYDEDDVEEIEIEEEVEEEEEEVEGEEEEEEEEDEEGKDQKQKEKPLDDDEDRKNPQFIPKKGYFYEHDDRTRTEDETPEEEAAESAKKEEKPKKPADGMDRWSHDKFDEGEQAPKSGEELSTVYGYDIRSEDQPPRARRRRRYGRGPTKYTRRWEEEEAYQKPRGGFRGRGSGRGFYRGSNRERRHSREEYDEDFPELGDSSSTSKATVNNEEKSEVKEVSKPSSSAPPPPKRETKEQPGRQDSARGEKSRDNNDLPPRREVRPSGNRDREQDRDRDRDYDNSFRGGRGRGIGNNRRGRRSEFTNRNRYPNRRDYRDDSELNDSPNNSNLHNTSRNSGGGSNNNKPFHSNNYEGRDREYTGPRPRMEGNRRDQKDFRTIVNGNSSESKPRQFSNENKQEKPQHQPPPQHRIPPFTNTEYPMPGKGTNNSNNRTGGNSVPNDRSRPHDRHNSTYADAVDDRHTHRDTNEPNEQPQPQKEVRDLREKLNAMRMQKGYQNQNDRRSQIPPRLQQQQQHQQHIDPTSKPRRYSTQRERPVQQQTIVTSGGMVIPNAVAPAAITQGVPPNMVPVVTMTDGGVPSTVAAYQPANYYEGTQVYEASGSPVTGSGPSVSPSLWTPHANAYATAPYPSPPTAPQVPQPPYGEPHPTAFIGPGGPAIYAAPPQFLQDPTLINYSGPAPAFPPPYHAHPQGFQGYAQVTPAPLPEVYHGGVTYYSTQNQIQRPPMMAPQKRPKSVLQLVEPPEKSKSDKGPKDHQHSEHQTELVGMNPIPETSAEAELSKKMEEVKLEPKENLERKPSPLIEFNEETSWAAEMELTSPTYPQGENFVFPKDEGKHEGSSAEIEQTQGITNKEVPNSVNHAVATDNHKEEAPKPTKNDNNEKKVETDSSTN